IEAVICPSKLLRGESQRAPGFGDFGERETFGHHADRYARTIIEQDGLTEYVRITAETAMPQTVAENDYQVFIRLILFGCESTAKDRGDSENLEGALGDKRALEYFWLGADG